MCTLSISNWSTEVELSVRVRLKKKIEENLIYTSLAIELISGVVPFMWADHNHNIIIL